MRTVSLFQSSRINEFKMYEYDLLNEYEKRFEYAKNTSLPDKPDYQ